MVCTNICLTEQKHELMGGCFACREMAPGSVTPAGLSAVVDGSGVVERISLARSLSHRYSSLHPVHAYTLGSWDSCGVAQNIRSGGSNPSRSSSVTDRLFLSPETDPWAQSHAIDFPLIVHHVVLLFRGQHNLSFLLWLSLLPSIHCDCIRTAQTVNIR